MRPPIRAVASVLLALALLAGCADDDQTDAGTTTAPATTGDRRADDSTTTTPTDDAIAIVVAEGEVVEGGGRHEVALGDTVAIRITSDTEDAAHVHGYDLMAQVGPDQVGTIEFTADIPGVFEVELEGEGRLLFELQVQ